MLTRTPVMAGVKLRDLPPETPLLISDGPSLVKATPIVSRLKYQGQSGQLIKQMNIMAMIFSRTSEKGRLKQ